MTNVGITKGFLAVGASPRLGITKKLSGLSAGRSSTKITGMVSLRHRKQSSAKEQAAVRNWLG